MNNFRCQRVVNGNVGTLPDNDCVHIFDDALDFRVKISML